MIIQIRHDQDRARLKNAFLKKRQLARLNIERSSFEKKSSAPVQVLAFSNRFKDLFRWSPEIKPDDTAIQFIIAFREPVNLMEFKKRLNEMAVDLLPCGDIE